MSKWANFQTETKPKIDALYVPIERAHRGSPSLVFNIPNRWGFSLKIAIRQIAKKLPEYHLPIKNEYLPMIVKTQENEEIEINTLGKWTFGTPGYMGHLLFEGNERKKVVIYYPKNSPKELLNMLEKAVRNLK